MRLVPNFIIYFVKTKKMSCTDGLVTDVNGDELWMHCPPTEVTPDDCVEESCYLASPGYYICYEDDNGDTVYFDDNLGGANSMDDGLDFAGAMAVCASEATCIWFHGAKTDADTDSTFAWYSSDDYDEDIPTDYKTSAQGV